MFNVDYSNGKLNHLIIYRYVLFIKIIHYVIGDEQMNLYSVLVILLSSLYLFFFPSQRPRLIGENDLNKLMVNDLNKSSQWQVDYLVYKLNAVAIPPFNVAF